MKVLLDECIPRKWRFALAGHDCLTVPEAGFAGTKNGALLMLAEAAGFEVFLTMDKGLQYQQNLTGRRVAILVVRSRSNRLRDLLPLTDDSLAALAAIQPGDVVHVGPTSN